MRDERDRALLVELTAGTLRWRAALDARLARSSRRPLGELSPGVRATLRLAAYQLAHLDRIPPHAAINESVELVRAIGEPRAAGFVNGVLRALQRAPRLALPARPAADGDRGSQLRYLSVTLSHPEWLAARWVERHGFEAAERWCQFNNAAPAVTVRSIRNVESRALLDALRAAGFQADPAPFVTDAIVLPPGVLGRLPASLADDLLVQDEASQIVARAVGASTDHRVLDVCAAPGAKTIVLAADVGKAETIVASDFRPSRVRLLRRTLRRAEADVPVVALDATRPLPFGRVFDRVFLDAPCSGLGIIRRDPDLKWSRRPEDLAGFAAVQRRMLERAAEVVAPGGRLVYATCSSEPEENEEVVAAFLARDARFETVSVALGPAVRGGDRFIGEDGFLRTRPFRDALDAFFAAALERRQTSGAV